MGRIKKLGNETVKGTAIFVMAFLFAVLFYLFCSGFFYYRDAGFLYSTESFPVIGILCMTAVLFFLLFYKIAEDIFEKCGKKALKIICFCLVFAALAVQIYFLFYVRSYYKWDSGFVIGAAASLAEKGEVAEEAFYYMSVYPNQNTFVLITAALVRLGNFFGIAAADRPLLFNLFNTVCLDFSVFLVIRILKKIRPGLSDREFCRILAILLCNPFLYVGVSYYYTITLSLPLSQGFLYLMLSFFSAEHSTQKDYKKEKEESEEQEKDGRECGKKADGGEDSDGKDSGRKDSGRKGQILKMVLAGALLGAGYELRATAVIFGIGAAAVGVWILIEGKCRKRGSFFLALCVMTATALLTASVLSAFQKNYVGIDTKDTAFPASHWVMMSLTMPGSHNGEDEAYTASFPTKEQKEEAVKARIKEKLSGMDPMEYLLLVKTKVKNTFGTGMNGYTTFLADALRTDGVYEGVFGSRRDIAVLWHQGYHLFMMLGILLAVGRFICDAVRGREMDLHVFLQGLILLGAILFYVLWEASEQYSVPFMMLMCSLGLTGYLDGNAKLQKDSRAAKAWGTILSGLSFCAAAFVLVFGMCRYESVTKVLRPWSHPAAVQILANRSYPVDDGTELVQRLKLSEPFNHLVIQWRNPAQENSTAVYSLSLKEEGSGKSVFEEEIRAAGTPYNGAGVYDFNEVVPDNGVYELCMEKTGGDPEDDLEFVVYDMYGYQPYPAGDLYLKENGEIKEMTASLLFSVSKEYEGSYMGKIKYIIFISLLFLIFLFMGFWCKLKIVWPYGGGKRND